MTDNGLRMRLKMARWQNYIMARSSRIPILKSLYFAIMLFMTPLWTLPLYSQQPMPAVGDTIRDIYVGAWVQNAPESGKAFHGQPVLLEFWSTWCRPCLAAVPHLNELHKEFGDRMQFVAITQETKTTAAPTLKKHPMRSAVAVDTEQGTTHKVFGVFVIPRTYILSPDRVVLWTGHPTRLTSGKLRELLEMLP
jgi:thiol-disulfide isomerase/thioredoxin